MPKPKAVITAAETAAPLSADNQRVASFVDAMIAAGFGRMVLSGTQVDVAAAVRSCNVFLWGLANPAAAMPPTDDDYDQDRIPTDDEWHKAAMEIYQRAQHHRPITQFNGPADTQTTPETTSQTSPANFPQGNQDAANSGASAKDSLTFPEANIFDGFGPTFGPHTLPIEALAPSPGNPRKKFRAETMRELADSIAAVGQKQRILARPVEPRQHVARPSTENKEDWCVFRLGTGGVHEFVRRVTGANAENEAGELARILSRATYQITGGERRWHALRMIGSATAKVEIEDVDDREALLTQITENGQREGVTAMEEASACQQLLDMGMTNKDIADKMGWSASKVSKRVALGNLPPEVRGHIDADRIEPSYGDRLQTYNGFPRVQVAIADAVAKSPNDWRAADLDGPMAQKILNVLRSAKLAREIKYDTKFDWKAICPECPYGAFRRQTYGSYGVCLKIAHYDELQREAKRVEKEAYDAAAAEALAKAQAAHSEKKGKAAADATPQPAPAAPAAPATRSLDLPAEPEPPLPPSEPKLPLIKEYGQGVPKTMRVLVIPGIGTKTASYHDGYHGQAYQRPPGCDAAVCECAGQAMYVPNNDVKRLQVLDVCHNGKRFDDLRNAAIAQEKQDRRDRFEKRAAQAADLLVRACTDARSGLDSRVLAAAFFSSGSERKTWEVGKQAQTDVAEFLRRLGITVPLTIFGKESTISVAKLQDAGANVLQIVAFAAWFRICSDITRAAEHGFRVEGLEAILLAGKEEAKANSMPFADETETEANTNA